MAAMMQQNIQRRYVLWCVPCACFSAFTFSLMNSQ